MIAKMERIIAYGKWFKSGKREVGDSDECFWYCFFIIQVDEYKKK